MIKNPTRSKTAVFIDAANLELSAKDLNFRIDYQKLHRWLKKHYLLVFLGFFTVRFSSSFPETAILII